MAEMNVQFTPDVTPEHRRQLQGFLEAARATIPDINRLVGEATQLRGKPVTLRISSNGQHTASADETTNTVRMDTAFLDGFGTRGEQGCAVRRPFAVTLAHELAHLADKELSPQARALEAKKNEPVLRAAQEAEHRDRFLSSSPERQAAMREMFGRDPSQLAPDVQQRLQQAGLTTPEAVQGFLTAQRAEIARAQEQFKENTEDKTAVVAEDRVAAQYGRAQGVPQRVQYANNYERQPDGTAVQIGEPAAPRLPWCNTQPDLLALPENTPAVRDDTTRQR